MSKMILEKSVKKEKLVKLSIEIINNKLVKARITGDFFIYPETAIGLIEKSLEIDLQDIDKALSIIEKRLKSLSIEMVGISVDTIMLLLKELLNKYEKEKLSE